MTIQAVNNNSRQNTMYAVAAGTLAGTAGAVAGYNFAPRMAYNIDEFLALDADTFTRTMSNIQNSNPDLYLKSYPLISAKIAQMIPAAELEHIFASDKISVDELKQYVDKQKIANRTTLGQITKLKNALESKKGKEISLAEYYELVRKQKTMPDVILNAIVDNLKEAIGEENFGKNFTVDDKLISCIQTTRDNVKNTNAENIQFIENLQALQKDGYVYKSDAVEAVKQAKKPALDRYIAEIKKSVSFDEIKRFVPRKGQAKWAAIVGGTTALVTALGVKLFGREK